MTLWSLGENMKLKITYLLTLLIVLNTVSLVFARKPAVEPVTSISIDHRPQVEKPQPGHFYNFETNAYVNNGKYHRVDYLSGRAVTSLTEEHWGTTFAYVALTVLFFVPLFLRYMTFSYFRDLASGNETEMQERRKGNQNIIPLQERRGAAEEVSEKESTASDNDQKKAS